MAPRTRKITLTLTDSEYGLVRNIAEADDRSISSWIGRAIREEAARLWPNEETRRRMAAIPITSFAEDAPEAPEPEPVPR